MLYPKLKERGNVMFFYILCGKRTWNFPCSAYMLCVKGTWKFLCAVYVLCLRAPLSNFHLRPCKIKKSKIAKLCHNKGLRKPFLEKYVLVCFDNYFTWTATFSVWGLVSEWKRLQNVAYLNRYFWNNEWVTWKSKQHGTTRIIYSPFSAVNGTIYQNWKFWPNFKT